MIEVLNQVFSLKKELQSLKWHEQYKPRRNSRLKTACLNLFTAFCLLNTSPLQLNSNSYANPTNPNNNIQKRYNTSSNLPNNEDISGGQELNRGEMPFLVHVTSGTYICTGSLINPNWVLTAAHCDHSDIGPTHVTLGEHSTTIDEGSEQRLQALQIIKHPDFKVVGAVHYNDVALIQIPRVTENEFIQIIPITTTEQITGTNTLVAGWGKTSDNSPIPNKPRKASMKVITNAKCDELYLGGAITDAMMCTQGEPGVDACPGDSGGPITTDSQPKYQIGVNSWGSDTCGGQLPPVAVRLSNGNIISWINKTITDNPIRESFLPIALKSQ